jgi:methylase of polypeptide subunit release factors
LSAFETQSASCLVELGKILKERGYRFTTITPNSHAHVLKQERRADKGLHRALGWNKSFDREDIDRTVFELLDSAGVLITDSNGYRSSVRVSTIADLIFLHSGFPTAEPDSVFFGPDTYRFVRALFSCLELLRHHDKLRIADVGCGSGAGGIALATFLSEKPQLILTDINGRALEYAAINAAINDVTAAIECHDVLDGIEHQLDIVISNPPYLVDDQIRFYRHGGEKLGTDLSVRIVREGLEHLKPKGRLVLYTGAPIVSGEDLLLSSITADLQLRATDYVYEEIDPDVFGDELQRPVYAGIDRIAAVVLTATK